MVHAYMNIYDSLGFHDVVNNSPVLATRRHQLHIHVCIYKLCRLVPKQVHAAKVLLPAKYHAEDTT